MKKIIYSVFSIFVLLFLSLWALGGSGMEIYRETTINASAEKVWTLLTDTNELKKWNPEIIEDTPLSDSPLEVGAKSKIIMKEGSGTAEYESEIVDVLMEEKLRVSLKGKSLGSNPMLVSYNIIKEADSLRLEYKSVWKPKEFWLRVMTPLIKMMANKNADKAMSSLKELAEK